MNGYVGRLHASGELPEGPATAADYRFDGGPTREQAADLADVLGLDGTVEDAGGAWTVMGSDPDGPALSVVRDAPGFWSYAQGAVIAEPADPDTAVSSDDDPGGVTEVAGPPPSKAEALDAVEPLLAELSLSDASVEASRTTAEGRTVSVTPEVDGLPVAGMETQLTVGPGGELVTGWGSWVPEVTAGEERETIGAQEALDAYNGRGADAEVPAELPAELPMEPQCAAEGGSGPAEIAPVPPEDGDYLEVPPAEPCGEVAKPDPVEVTTEFGLALHYSRDEALLVPSWLFHATTRDDLDLPLWYPAVPFEIGSSSGNDSVTDSAPGAGAGGDGGTAPGDPGPAEEPGAGSEAGDLELGAPGMSVESYDASGRTLSLSFWGSVCDDYEATAEESAEEIVVHVEPTNPDEERMCVMSAESETAEVTLSEPVGDRTVVDWNGQEIPVR
jgi:hypothetical protein